MEGLLNTDANVVFDHQLPEQFAVNKDDPALNLICESFGLRCKVGCGDEYAFGCLGALETACEAPNFRLADRGIDLIALGLDVDAIEPKR